MRDMLGRSGSLPAEEALGLIISNLTRRTTQAETASLESCTARVLAQDIIAPEDVPGFARSSMDGYAVRAADTYGAGDGNPLYLNVTGEIPMGGAPASKLTPGSAHRIATGGMLPEGADAVLMLEYAEDLGGGMIEAVRALAPGENVIQRGDDICAGETLMKAGRRLKPHDAAVLASIGITGVPVRAMPVVDIISTGDELVEPDAQLPPAHIRDSNSYHLAALVTEAGARARRCGIIKDVHGDILNAVRASAGRADIVLITGGSSVGARDMTERVISDLGRVLFHSVSLKPGKPLLTGLVSDTPVFGLPGHPRAVAVCFELFVLPVINLLLGLSQDEISGLTGTVVARLAKSVHCRAGRMEIVPVRLERHGEGLVAIPLLGKSGLLMNMVQAHGTISIPANSQGAEAGEQVMVRLY